MIIIFCLDIHRTGTAVNPLLRALYLVRYQNEQTLKDITGNKSIGTVALVIPWLESVAEREKLYGVDTAFSNGAQGMKEQEEWIRTYAKERCGMEKEAERLKIVWYPAFYLAGFGSIFPKVDLCNFIPQDLVDVAILEEPEHLNWFRMPKLGDVSVEDEQNLDVSIHEGIDEKLAKPKVEITIDDCSGNTGVSSPVKVVSHDDSSQQTFQSNAAVTTKPALERSKLGWTHRFRFVVGIVHTNYEAYARQYGIGASLIAAPAIGAVSALTIRAYCHQVIKLSDTLPSFAPGKECTCNVHGVRREFLEGKAIDYKELISGPGNEPPEEEPASVYFIGKLVWAKGFDLMLEVQDIFKKKNKQYFSIDIYGGGPDEKSIARAFHGRSHSSPTKRPAKKPLLSPSPSLDAINPKDLNAAAVFSNPNSIREQTSKFIDQMKSLRTSSDDVVAQYLSIGFEVSNNSSRNVTYVKENRNLAQQASTDPLNILGDLSVKSVGTGMAVSNAVYNIADSSIKNILKTSFSQLKIPKRRQSDKEENDGNDEADVLEQRKHFVFDPPQSRWELRRHPIPAKFPGVIDHAQLLSVPHKIFLNPSTSEVLCTTTAEALAMGKFVILPKHPSNEFFLQFTNCLAYETLEECAEKLKWALERYPAPLSEEERHKFTWEAATERLIASSLVTVREARERAEKGMDKTDARIAFWLSESGEKGNMLRSLFSRKGERSSHPSPNWNDEQA